MMTLSHNGALAVHRPGRSIIIDRITPTHREEALVAIGHSPTVARAVVNGDLAVRIRAIDLARYIGLLSKPDTQAARAAGLVQ